MEEKSNLEDAVSYAGIGWKIFPCNPETKAPLVKGGFHSATSDADQIRDWWTSHPRAAIGVACKGSNLFVMDLDRNHGNGRDGVIAWKFLCQNKPVGADDSLVARTKNGGEHHLFRRPKGEIAITTTNNIVPGSGIDVRGDGGYFIAPSTCEPERQWTNGDPHEDAPSEAPPWLLQMVMSTDRLTTGSNKGGVHDRQMPLSPAEVSNIRDALGYIDNDDHDVWYKVGMALKSTSAKNQALGLWAEWSSTSPKWDEKAALKRWESFKEFHLDGSEITMGTLYRYAQDGGWAGDPMVESEEVIPPPVSEPVVKQVGDKKKVFNRRPFPKKLLSFPGLVSDVAHATLRMSSHSPQPAFAFAAGLATAAAVLGRRVELECGMRTNIYLTIVGPTGCGKDAPLKAPAKLLGDTGVERIVDRIGPESWTSDTALRNALHVRPVQLTSMDEAGIWLQKLHGANVSSADRSAKKLFLSLFSAGRGDVLRGTAFADSRDRPQVDLVEPCFTFLGAGVPSNCFPAIGSEGMEDGLLNRILFIHADDRAPDPLTEEEMADFATREQAVSAIIRADRAFGGQSSLPTDDGVGAPTRDPIIIRWSDDAKKALDQYNKLIRQQMRNSSDSREVAFLSRKIQSIKKVSLILSASLDPDLPISLQAYEYAKIVVDWSYERTEEECMMHVTESVFQRRVVKMLHWAEEVGGSFTKTQAARKFNGMTSRERTEVFNTLVEGGFLHPEKVGNGVRFRTTGVTIGDRQQ